MGILENILSAMGRSGGLDAAGQGFSAGATLYSGFEARRAAGFQADQLRANASTAMAIGQRNAAEADRQAQLVNSRALAVAAASGGGASDPGVVSLIARNAAEGAYRRQSAIYEGEDRARIDNARADAAEYGGKAALAHAFLAGGAQLLGAETTLMKGNAKEKSLRERFGGDGPVQARGQKALSGWDD